LSSLIFDGLDEKLVHYTKDMRQQFLAELMRVFPNTHLVKSTTPKPKITTD
jgi:hypothetical protein